jgi:hypothetical protein
MLAARALGRALSAPKGAATQNLLTSLACTTTSSSSSFQDNASSWTSILDSYTRRSTSSACFASSGVSQNRDKSPQEKKVSVLPATGAAAQRYLTSSPIRAADSHPSSSAMDTNVDGGGGYMLLSFAHATAASICLFMPEMVGNLFFPGAALPQGFETQALVQLLGSGLAAGSASCYALKQFADNDDLKNPTAQRLQLGLMSFSTAAIGTHLMYSPSITISSLATGAVVMGTTGGLAYSSYTRSLGPVKVGDVLSRYFGAVPDHLRISNLQSGLFSILTPTLALAGASYFVFPGYSLAEVFGYVKAIDSFFWWQNIGGALMTIAPALTYSLKKEADAGKLGEPVAKTLSAGLLVTALGHLWVLGPMLMNAQGGGMLPYVVGAWATAASAGALGLFGGAAAAGGSAGAGVGRSAKM